MGKENNIRGIDIILLLYVISVFVFSTDDTLYRYSNYAFLVFAASTFLWRGLRCGWKISYYGLKEYIPFFFLTIVSIPFALNNSLSLEICRTEFLLIIMVIMVYNCYVNDGNIEWILISFLVGGTLVSLQVISEYGINGVFSGLLGGNRVGNDLFQLNYLGRFSYWAALIAMYYAFVKRKVLCYVIFAVNVLVCIGSGSRQAWIALVICLLILVLSLNGGNLKARKYLATLLFVCAAYIVVTNPAFDAVLQRLNSGLASFFNSTAGTRSDQIRVEMIRVGWNTFIHNPIIGVGYGNVAEIATGMIQNYGYLHNNYLELLACGGILGFVAYYVMYILLFKRLSQVIKSKSQYENLARFATILLIGQLIMDMFAVSYYSKHQFLIFAFSSLVVYRNQYAMNKGEER